MLLGPVDERGLKALARLIGPIQRCAQPEAQVGRDLVVARAGGVQAAGGRADHRGEPGLDVHVDIFEGAVEGEGALLDLGPHAAEALRDRVRVGPCHDPLLGQHGHMGDRALDVLGVEPAVEVDRGVDRLHHLVGRRLEAAAPHAVRRVRGR